MKLSSSLALICLTVLIPFAACARADEPNVMEKMVGKWEATNGPIKGAIFEFGKDGSMTLKVADMLLKGKFTVASKDVVEFTLQEKTSKVPYKFEKDALNLTDPEGNVIKCVKLK